ncbi:MAG: NAD(P)H-dependent oxidoreductase [Desulfovibrionaceae bacterium]|nr:NAD(P)H-dependent oxidoreductase [Desulfovibrionaceae bacterium]
MLAASPRAGNTLEAARLFAAGFARKRDGLSTILLSDYRVLPCQACGACDSQGGVCPQAALDDSLHLFDRLVQAPFLALAAPIYFYHLPAQLKALLDRCQFYHQAAARGEFPQPGFSGRPVRVILLGARITGKELFRGSLLSLKWALAPLGFELAEPLLLRGLDGPADLQTREDFRELLLAYGEAAAGDLPC